MFYKFQSDRAHRLLSVQIQTDMMSGAKNIKSIFALSAVTDSNGSLYSLECRQLTKDFRVVNAGIYADADYSGTKAWYFPKDMQHRDRGAPPPHFDDLLARVEEMIEAGEVDLDEEYDMGIAVISAPDSMESIEGDLDLTFADHPRIVAW